MKIYSYYLKVVGSTFILVNFHISFIISSSNRREQQQSKEVNVNNQHPQLRRTMKYS